MKATDTVIDIVISWVNGRDPRHRLKMAPYLGRSLAIHDDINGDTRFNSEGEIFLCLASILRFAPFVNRIFIITDEQNKAIGIFTDGDLRRLIIQQGDIRHTKIKDVMSLNPKSIHFRAMAIDAVTMMEQSKLSQLIVIDDDKHLVGALHMHDLMAAKVI